VLVGAGWQDDYVVVWVVFVRRVVGGLGRKEYGMRW